MKKARMLGAFIASSFLLMQSCSKNETPLNEGAVSASKKAAKASWVGGDPIINGTWKFVDYVYIPKAVCVVGNSTGEGALIHHWNFGNHSGQRWAITALDATYFKIVNVNSNKALEVPV